MSRDGFLKKLDFPISVLFRFLKYFSFGKTDDKCLVVRPGGMGDLILFDLAIRMADFDVNSFIFIIQKRAEPWAKFRNLNYVLLDQNFLKFLFFSKYKYVICSEQYFASAADFSQKFVKKDGSLMGFDSNRRSKIFSKSVKYSENLHESSNFLSLLSLLPSMGFRNLAPDKNSADVKTSRYCVLSIGGGKSQSRNLDVESWSYLVKALNKENLPVYLTHAPQDFSIASLVSHVVEFDKISTSFEESVSFIQGSEFLISIDSGMVHVASFFDVPARVLFTSANIEKWRPLASSSLILSHDYECQPCSKFGQVPPCSFNFRCSKNLTAMRVHN